MSDREKAVALARDVIAQLNSPTLPYSVEPGTYIWSDTEDEIPRNEDLQQHLPTLFEGRCRVCAIGALFLSQVRLYDAIPASAMTSFSLHAYLKDSFDSATLGLIESAFERSYAYGRDAPFSDVVAATSFGRRYIDSKERLRAIMQNVVDHYGVFVPPSILEVSSGT